MSKAKKTDWRSIETAPRHDVVLLGDATGKHVGVGIVRNEFGDVEPALPFKPDYWAPIDLVPSAPGSRDRMTGNVFDDWEIEYDKARVLGERGVAIVRAILRDVFQALLTDCSWSANTPEKRDPRPLRFVVWRDWEKKHDSALGEDVPVEIVFGPDDFVEAMKSELELRVEGRSGGEEEQVGGKAELIAEMEPWRLAIAKVEKLIEEAEKDWPAEDRA
jgi:hypothetical protein